MRALRKILVVDDDPVVGKSFDRVLSEKGYAVITARNGEEALKKLAEENYDAVFTDIKMPGMDGIQVAERVKARRPWIPVVIVTGYGTADNEARAEAAGVSGFLHKPLSPEMIEGSTQKALLEKDLAGAPATATETAAMPQPTAATEESAWKSVALVFAAPFVGLAYVVALPFIGLGMLAWMGAKALVPEKVARFLKNIALFFAAPFVALAYTIAFPFIGLGMLAWMGAKALVKRADSE
ncbi:MAG: response regulator [Betaproteobacteria bacterium]|nr:response regulator [Betaproteobacteria bacterium]